MLDPTPHEDLPKAPPLSEGPRPFLDRLRMRPWPRVDILLLKTRTCPLCDEALDLLRRRAGPLGLTLRVEDITDNARLMDAYGTEIPVVFVAGRKRFFGLVAPALLAREVDAARSAARE